MSRSGDGDDEAWTQGKERWQKVHGFGNVQETKKKKKKNQTGLDGDLDVPSGSLPLDFGSVHGTELKISRGTTKVPLPYSCYRFGFCFTLFCLFPHPFSRQCHKVQNQRLNKYMLWGEGLQSMEEVLR